jgi:protein-tyrosine phosphatase
MVAVLFVCMGNICRSPSAEGAFLRLLEENGLLAHIEVDSAGTHGYHVGGQADSRSMAHAQKRGIDITPHRARQVASEDFERYDYILAMDNDNYERLQAQCPDEHLEKVQLFLEYAPHMKLTEVPDPYYGGEKGFEHVLDLVEAASEGLLAHIRERHLSRLEA